MQTCCYLSSCITFLDTCYFKIPLCVESTADYPVPILHCPQLPYSDRGFSVVSCLNCMHADGRITLCLFGESIFSLFSPSDIVCLPQLHHYPVKHFGSTMFYLKLLINKVDSSPLCYYSTGYFLNINLFLIHTLFFNIFIQIN